MENAIMSNQASKLHIEVMVITSAIAKEFLAKSNGNRRDSTNRINEYGMAMENGEFTISNDMICFDEDGVLVNGHHRLKACIKSGTPFLAVVAYGMPSNAVYDRGRKRSVGDMLYMNGSIPREMSSARMISIATQYIQIADTSYYSSIPSYIIRDFINENAGNMLKAFRISCSGKTNAICRKAPVQAAILAALKYGVSEETLFDFAKAVNTGFIESFKQSAAILLRNYILSNIAHTGAKRACQLCAFAQIAIQDFVNGTPRKRNYQKLYFPYIPDAKIKLD